MKDQKIELITKLENSKELGALILSYRNKILNTNFHESVGGNVFRTLILKDYDEHFKITHSFKGII